MSRRIQTGSPAIVTHTSTLTPPPQPSIATLVESAEEDFQGPLTLGIAPKPIVFATTSTPAIPPDGYLDRLVKYIPAEIIALYLGAANVVPSTDPSFHAAIWIIAILTTLCTPIYMYFSTRETGQPTLWSQIVISSIAFPIWVFAIGGPFRFFSWYEQKRWVGALVITFFTFLLGSYNPSPTPATPPPPATPTPEIPPAE
jgi:hypothetical protein